MHYFIAKFNHNKRRPHRRATRRAETKANRTPEEQQTAAAAARTNQENHRRNKQQAEETEGISTDLLQFTNSLTNQLSTSAANMLQSTITTRNHKQIADAEAATVEEEARQRLREHKNKGEGELTEQEIKAATLAGTIPYTVPDSGASDTCVKTETDQI